MIRTGKWDQSFFSGIRFDHHLLESGRDYFIVLGQKKNRGSMDRCRVCYAVEISRNSPGTWTRQKPEIPPTVLLQNDLP